jgi:hypothetical protein
MGPWVSLLLAVSFALSCSLVTYLLTRLKMERAAGARVKELAEAVAALENEKAKFDEAAKGIEESARRKALDEFLSDLRVEERRYVREHRVLFMNRKSLVLEERIFFRNIPISNWVEHEIPVEEGADLEAVAKTMRVFGELDSGAPRKQLFRAG